MDMDMDTAMKSSNLPSSTAAPSMSNNSCKMSMLLNWHTLDTCYLTSTLHIRTPIHFTLICLFSFLLPIILEITRRYQRIYDRYLRAKQIHHLQNEHESSPVDEISEKLLGGPHLERTNWDSSVVLEQGLRAGLHLVQFALSYCVMMMWMYSNGYILISILLGAMTGFGIFTRDTFAVFVQESGSDERKQTCC
ncbi:hypothetical protein DID88_008055 [Monilinia fructigena]|uniref:Copper transport protein n=1 Tax=Monilinia fructigena TaxID=38457 RepID=A0A395J4L6_9HELO|nr:hypothetical protein DID88_008055 [Monilinia fructigena]